MGLDTVPLVEVRSALVGPDGAGGDVRSHGSMEWIPGQTLHFDVPKEVTRRKMMDLYGFMTFMMVFFCGYSML